MKEKYLTELKNELNELNKPDDYIDACINYADKLISSKMPVIFDREHFALLLGMDVNELWLAVNADDKYRYRVKSIPKKSGGQRIINMPSMTLKYIQRWLLDNIIENMHCSEVATGFRQGKSIIDNALKHINKKCVLNMDLENFFPSITYGEVFNMFFYYGYTYELSNLFAQICTYEGVLPQGSPASPGLANVRCLKLDKRLKLLADKCNATYTRYADDITISSNGNIDHLKNAVTKIVEEEGLRVNKKKTRVLYHYQRQEVTGIIVNNDKIRIPKEYKRELQKEIYFCKKYGPSNHQKFIKDGHRYFKEHLYGKAYYIKMIEPDFGDKMLKELDEIDWDL